MELFLIFSNIFFKQSSRKQIGDRNLNLKCKKSFKKTHFQFKGFIFLDDDNTLNKRLAMDFIFATFTLLTSIYSYLHTCMYMYLLIHERTCFFYFLYFM